MTTRANKNTIRVLAIAPSSRGFGFAVMERETTLVDWGVRSVNGDKSAGTLKKAELMISHYKPTVLILQDAKAKGTRRSGRIRTLVKAIGEITARQKIKVVFISRDQMMNAFFEDGAGTKHMVAQLLARRFPDELGHRLPPKRKPWNSEDYRMGIFDAVALSFAYHLRK